MFGDFAVQTKFTSSYNNPEYNFEREPVVYKPSHYLNQEEVYYDIKERNKLILKDDDDDDDDFSKLFKR